MKDVKLYQDLTDEPPVTVPPRLMEYSWRSVDRDDIPAIKALTAAAAEVDKTGAAATEEGLA